jgi:hypothetical protein
MHPNTIWRRERRLALGPSATGARPGVPLLNSDMVISGGLEIPDCLHPAA